MNRIDSRARGNAPQLLEKYKKLAHDAHLNGDRVTEEYYLQFADHYFRVIADQRQRQEEARQPRRDDQRGADYGEDFSAEEELYGETGGERFATNGNRDERSHRDDRANRDERGGREERGNRDDRGNREQRAETVAEEAAEAAPDGERSVYEPAENPFVRPNRSPRGLKPRKPRRGEDNGAQEAAQAENDQNEGGQAEPAPAFDPAILPPSIATTAEGETAEEKPKRRRTRRTTATTGQADEAVESVN